MQPHEIAADKYLTEIANLALSIHGTSQRVKDAILRAIDLRTDQRENQTVYMLWVDSRDIIGLALRKYREYFGDPHATTNYRLDTDL